MQHYTNRTNNATIQNGNLLIIAKKETYQGSDYTSARLITKDKQSWKYGKMEARIKIPKAQGLWPAFWMLGDNISTVGWPSCGEIDIMEHINSDDKIFGTMHWNTTSHAYYGGDTFINDVSLFHIYSVEWNSSKIKWFVDGKKYWEGDILNNINSSDELHNPFFLILNMAVGGNFPGNPTSNSIISDTLMVDYVRVYENQQFPTSINDTRIENNIIISPNPIQNFEQLKIQFENIGDYKIDIIDFMGRVCTTLKTNVTSTSDNLLIPINHLTQGLYLVNCTNDNSFSSNKIMILE